MIKFFISLNWNNSCGVRFIRCALPLVFDITEVKGTHERVYAIIMGLLVIKFAVRISMKTK